MPDELRPLDDNQPAIEEQSDAEQRMRRALGLGSGGLGSGESGGKAPGTPAKAPVFVPRRSVNPEAANRVVEAQAALAAERLAREQAEAALRHAEDALRHAETRRVQAELARDEAVAALAGERSARTAAEQTLLERASVSAQPQVMSAETPRRRGRPPKSAQPSALATSDDAPVEWWIPGWKTRLPRAG
jgi:hypothetical protein